MPNKTQRIEHRLQPGTRNSTIKVVTKAFEIDIRGINRAIQFGAWLRRNVPRTHRNRFHTALAAGGSNIDRIFGKNRRIVIGERHRIAAGAKRCLRDSVGRGPIGEVVDLARSRNIPVLAKFAAEITAGGAKTQHRGARIKMIQRLFFNRIDTKPA